MLPILLADVLAAASPFWSEVDELCKDPVALAAIEPEKLGDAVEAREQVFIYCKTSTAPRFAARSDRERLERLERIYVALGKTPPAAIPLPDASSEHRLAFLEHVTTNDDAELGLAGQRMLSALLAEICKLADASRVLPLTCAAAKGSPTLKALRAAVLLDLADATLRAADGAAKSTVLQVAALFALVIHHPDLGRATDRLEGMVPDGSACTSSASREACEYSVSAMRILARVTTRILRDGPKVDRDVDHYDNVVEEVLRDEAKKPELTLTPALKTATRQLVDAMKTARIVSARERVSPVDVEKANLLVFERAAVLAAFGAALVRGADDSNAKAFTDATERAVETTTRLLDLLAATKPRDFFEATKPILAASGADHGGPSAAQLRALGAAASLAAAHDGDDLRRAARDALVPMPAWVDRFVFDINAAPPQMKDAHGSSNLSINGDATVGYNGDHLGFVAHGETAYYDVTNQGNSSLTERYEGSGDVWGVIDLSRTVALEPRFSGQFLYYGTLADEATAGQDRQTNQDSYFGRASGLLGVRVRPHPRIALAASGGLGAQYENYYAIIQTSNGAQGTDAKDTFGLQEEGHLRFQWTIVPSIVSFRARGDVAHFSLQRDDQALVRTLGVVTTATSSTVEIEQTEIYARGFIDADIARFFGFVPAVHAGANVFMLAAKGQTTTTTVPVFGIGIRREAL